MADAPMCLCFLVVLVLEFLPAVFTNPGRLMFVIEIQFILRGFVTPSIFPA